MSSQCGIHTERSLLQHLADVVPDAKRGSVGICLSGPWKTVTSLARATPVWTLVVDYSVER